MKTVPFEQLAVFEVFRFEPDGTAFCKLVDRRIRSMLTHNEYLMPNVPIGVFQIHSLTQRSVEQEIADLKQLGIEHVL